MANSTAEPVPLNSTVRPHLGLQGLRTAPPAANAEDAVAIERMLDDGAPTPRPRAARRSRVTSLQLADEASAVDRATQRETARRIFRLYCFACGRSREQTTPPPAAGRCPHCGGTMLLERVPV